MIIAKTARLFHRDQAGGESLQPLLQRNFRRTSGELHQTLDGTAWKVPGTPSPMFVRVLYDACWYSYG